MNYLLIDTSYLNFYRYYATLQWYKRSHTDVDIDTILDWTLNEDFMKTYNKMYRKCIKDFVSKYNIDPSKIIFAFDCPRNEIWRMKSMPTYKSNRVEQQSNFKGGPVFKYSKSTIIPELCKEYNCTSIKIDTAEADDIIGVIKKNIRKLDPIKPIYIITSDHDYLQLIDTNTHLYTLQNKYINEKSCGDAKRDLLIKIIQGDMSDCIPSCFPRCGYKTALKLASDNTLLEKKLNENQEYRNRFTLNQKMIDMDYIPNEIQKLILDKL